MLVLSRKTNESIMIGDNIEIIVSRIDRQTVRLAISAPKEVLVLRGELWEEVNKLHEIAQLKRPRRNNSPGDTD